MIYDPNPCFEKKKIITDDICEAVTLSLNVTILSTNYANGRVGYILVF